jgi:two-component system NtrC family sensor kinase
MSILGKLKPKFWDYEDVAAGPYKYLFNFRRIWRSAFLFTAGVSLIPLILMIFADYKVTHDAIESEIVLRTSGLVSNIRKNIFFFLNEQKSALDFVGRDNSFEELNDPSRLAVILENLEKGFGGFSDLGIIDFFGLQRSYVGPYKPERKNYGDQMWFKKIQDRGVYISDVFMGFRQVPHLFIAVRHKLPDGTSYVLRGTIDIDRLKELFSELKRNGSGDAFIINREGILQTSSSHHGKVLEKISLPVPGYSSKTEVLEIEIPGGEPLIIGYAYIPDTQFILMFVKQKEQFLEPWFKTHGDLVWILVVSITIILLVILGVGTHLVKKMHEADQRRIMVLHQVEYSNKMASIGRLATGAAHEINNPLAVINEKTGLIMDMFTLEKKYAKNPKLMVLVASILSEVQRCGSITKRLLNFAQHIDVDIQLIDLEKLISDVLSLLGEEPEHRSITVSVNVQEDIPQIESDQGTLQQIFLNLFNYAFEGMGDGGDLKITIKHPEGESVLVTFTDNGHGIPRQDLDRIFDPFFSSKAKKIRTGLGLSITYVLVLELGAQIKVESELGKGTSFIIALPINYEGPKNRGETS